MVTDKEKKSIEHNGVRPLQSLSYDEKKADDFAWFKKNANFYIDQSQFLLSTDSKDKKFKNKNVFYNAYNNDIDANEFDYITNPLNSKNELYKKFPARLRAYNIIRPNIDLLIG